MSIRSEVQALVNRLNDGPVKEAFTDILNRAPSMEEAQVRYHMAKAAWYERENAEAESEEYKKSKSAVRAMQAREIEVKKVHDSLKTETDELFKRKVMLLKNIEFLEKKRASLQDEAKALEEAKKATGGATLADAVAMKAKEGGSQKNKWEKKKQEKEKVLEAKKAPEAPAEKVEATKPAVVEVKPEIAPAVTRKPGEGDLSDEELEELTRPEEPAQAQA